MLKKKNKPEMIKVSSKNLDEIQLRLAENSLNDADKKILSTILITYQWLFCQLQMTKFSMRKLKSVFGFKTEKKSNLKSGKSQDVKDLLNNTEQNSAQLPAVSNNQEVLQKKP